MHRLLEPVYDVQHSSTTEDTFIDQLWLAIGSNPLLAQSLLLQCQANAAPPLPVVACMASHAAAFVRLSRSCSHTQHSGGHVAHVAHVAPTPLPSLTRHLGCVLKWDHSVCTVASGQPPLARPTKQTL